MQENRVASRRTSDGAKARAPQSNAPDTDANVRAAGIVMVIAFALMALFNSSDLRSFARDLPANWLTDHLVVAADRWHERMLAYGPGHVRPAVHDLVNGFREMRW